MSYIQGGPGWGTHVWCPWGEGFWGKVQCIMDNGHMGLALNRQTHRYDWKHYLPVILLTGGNNSNAIKNNCHSHQDLVVCRCISYLYIALGLFYYRPQTNFAKVLFSQVSLWRCVYVCHTYPLPCTPISCMYLPSHARPLPCTTPATPATYASHPRHAYPLPHTHPVMHASAMHTPYHACPPATLPHHACPCSCHACPPAMHVPNHAYPPPTHVPPATYAPPTTCSQWAGGTHPTRMHSYFTNIYTNILIYLQMCIGTTLFVLLLDPDSKYQSNTQKQLIPIRPVLWGLQHLTL